jgi:hypothetical protein
MSHPKRPSEPTLACVRSVSPLASQWDRYSTTCPLIRALVCVSFMLLLAPAGESLEASAQPLVPLVYPACYVPASRSPRSRLPSAPERAAGTSLLSLSSSKSYKHFLGSTA